MGERRVWKEDAMRPYGRLIDPQTAHSPNILIEDNGD
jgi:hypothetical protein